MTEMKIECPKCGTHIEVDKVQEQRVLERYQKVLTDKADEDKRKLDAERAKFLEEKTKQEEAIKKAREEYAAKLKEDRTKMMDQATLKAQKNVEATLSDFQEQIKQKDTLIQTIQKSELELMKQKNELEMRGKALELEVMKRLETEKQKIYEESNRMAEEKHRFELANKMRTIDEMKKVIEELNNKAKDTSQQRQGEIAEVEIENSLRAAYPNDEVSPVPKGVRGADISLTVQNGMKRCGTIIIEAKQTKHWSNSWIQKLKQDQVDARADVAVLVTTAMPDGERQFLQKDGVWITDYTTFIGLISVLRNSLIDISRMQVVNENRAGKMHKIMNYVTSNEFGQKVQAVMETVVKLQADLANEKSALEKTWARREKLIQSIASTVAGVSGDIDGLLGTDSQPLQIAQ